GPAAGVRSRPCGCAVPAVRVRGPGNPPGTGPPRTTLHNSVWNGPAGGGMSQGPPRDVRQPGPSRPGPPGPAGVVLGPPRAERLSGPGARTGTEGSSAMKRFSWSLTAFRVALAGPAAPARADLAWYCDPNTVPHIGASRVGGDNDNTFFQTYMVQ